MNHQALNLQIALSNFPGLVVQFHLKPDNKLVFDYLSEGCLALLGCTPEQLRANPQKFSEMMNVRERATLFKRLQKSEEKLTFANWEGRVWIDGWQDTKWINLRATPRRVSMDNKIQFSGVMMNITHSKLEKLEIEESRRKLAELTAHLETIKEEERAKIAREIHDDLGGNLTVIKIGLSNIMSKLQENQTHLKTQGHGLEGIVDNTFNAIHRISHNLRPTVLDLGIVDAIDWQLEEFKKQSGIACSFVSNQSEIAMTSEQSMALFRIFQEALSNIGKHAHAKQVEVHLIRENCHVELTIRDDGIGIKPKDKLKTNSFGLHGMKERIEMQHGALLITKVKPKGTLIKVNLPIG